MWHLWKGEGERRRLVVVGGVLLLVVVIGGYYIYRQKRQMAGLVEAFELEKALVSEDLNELSLQYEGYKFSVGNDSLMELLQDEQAKVSVLLEELRTVKATNARRIGELKREIEVLRKVMRGYVVQIDSLNRVNEELSAEKERAVRGERAARSVAAELGKALERQTERVNLASRLDATGISVRGVDGRGKEVKHIRQMEQLEVRFRIGKNITAPVGEKMVYVRLQKPDDEVLVKSWDNLFGFEGKEIVYSMKKLVEYSGEEVEVRMYWDIEEYLMPGAYRLDIFADGNLIGRQSFQLDK